MTENPEKLNNHALALASSGNYEDAILCLKRAVTIDQNNYLLWYNLGLTLRDSGDLLGARDALNTSFQLNPEYEETILALTEINLNLEDYEELVFVCSFGLGLNPENFHIWNNLGVMFFKTADYEAASEAFERAISFNPYYYDALFNLHDTYEELGNKTGMEECAKKLREISKNIGRK